MSIVFSYDGINKKQRHLPHWTKKGVTYWITFRLRDSLPQEKLNRWRIERDFWLEANPEPWTDIQWNEYNQRFGLRFNEWLDAGAGSCILARSDVRGKVCECLTAFNNDRYRIIASVIMPNHVHMLLETADAHLLSNILKGMKGTSARKVNQLLNESGSFWADESYDHIVRSETQLHFLIEYVKNNPIKAGLKPDQYWLQL
ncbi:MAG: transposase [Victivallaceae bacterium]|jgi:type I restriction enzyme R subunit